MRTFLVVCAVVAFVATSLWYVEQGVSPGERAGSSHVRNTKPGPSDIGAAPVAASALADRDVPNVRGDAVDQAEAASRSTDPVRIYSWLEKTRECLGLLAIQDDLLVFVAGGVSKITGERSEQRRIAIDGLVLSCSDFARAGRPKVAALHGMLLARATEVAPEWAGTSSELSLFLSAVKYLKSRDPALVDAAVDRLLRSVELEVSQQYEDIALLAMLGASCDLGVDCSSRGLRMVKLCALSGVCEGDWTAHLTSQLDAEGRARFTEIRRQYVEWLRIQLGSEAAIGGAFKVDDSRL